METILKLAKILTFTILLIIASGLSLIFIFCIETLHYAGFAFPYLFLFFTIPLLIGITKQSSFLKSFMTGMTPYLFSIIFYSIYLIYSIGFSRFQGWLRDLGMSLFIFAGIWFVVLIIGWLFQNRNRKEKIGLAILLIISFIIGSGLQVYFTDYYHLLKYEYRHVLSPQNLEDKTHAEAFTAVWDYLNQHYPYFSYKKINWEEIKFEFQDRLPAATSDEEFHNIIYEMITHLQDPHIKIFSPARDQNHKNRTNWGIRVSEIEDKWVIRKVFAGSAAAAIGLKPGFILLKIENTSLAELFKQQSDQLLTAKEGSIRDQRFGNQIRLQALLSEKTGATRSLTFLDHQEIEQTKETILKTYDYKPEQNIHFKRLKEGFGYIKIKRMAANILTFIPQFDKALKELRNTRGLIIDVRGNLGGAIIFPDQILGRFTSQKIQYGNIRNAHDDLIPLWIVPRRPLYNNPVIILIDEGCLSAGEYFAYAAGTLKQVKRIGRPTKGQVSGPSRSMILPGKAKIRLYSSGLADLKGQFVVEWTGVQPDIEVPYSIEDIKKGIDSDLKKAIELLKD